MRDTIFHKRWLLWIGLSMLLGYLVGGEVSIGRYPSVVVIMSLLVLAAWTWRWSTLICVTVSLALGAGGLMKYAEPAGQHPGQTSLRVETAMRIEQVVVKGGRQQLVTSFRRGLGMDKALIHLRTPCICEKGDWINLDQKLYRPGGPRQPGGFDYAAYLARQDILWVGYADGADLRVEYKTEDIGGAISSLRAWLLHRIDNDHSPHGAAMMKGILLGDKSDMTKEQRDGYARSGIAYVFAVSGMHVGLLYGVVLLLLGRFRYDRRWMTVMFTSLVLVVIWAFIAVVGYTPSAVRAGVMLSLYEIGKLTYRRIDKWQILGSSLVLAMIMDPGVSSDIGFQFSYVALASIFLLYGRLNRLISSRYKLIQWAWSMIAISLSAQAGLLPLSVYYFGGFSPWFWFTGFFAVIIVTACFALGLLSIVLSGTLAVSSCIAPVIAWLFESLDYIIAWVNKWPASYISLEVDWIDVTQICVIMGLFVIGAKVSSRQFEQLRSYALAAFMACLIWSPMVSLLQKGQGYVFEEDGVVRLGVNGHLSRTLGRGQENVLLRNESTTLHILHEANENLSIQKGDVLLTSKWGWKDKRRWKEQHPTLSTIDINRAFFTITK